MFLASNGKNTDFQRWLLFLILVFLCLCFSVLMFLHVFAFFVSVSLSASPTSRLLVVFRDLLCETMRWGQVAKKRLSASAFFVYWISDDAMVTCDVILSEVGFLGLSRVINLPL